MERMKDLTQQYVEQLENMVKDLREKKLELEEENKNLKSDLAFERTMLDNVRAEYKSLQNVKEKLIERIDTMQEFIDYSEGVVQNAIGMLYEEGGGDKALDYLENCYVTGDDKQYEEMERLYKDED